MWCGVSRVGASGKFLSCQDRLLCFNGGIVGGSGVLSGLRILSICLSGVSVG